MTHDISITRVDAPYQRFPVLATCSCNFQSHCRSEEEAKARLARHLRVAGIHKDTKGMPVKFYG